jgi:hypothetical protein
LLKDGAWVNRWVRDDLADRRARDRARAEPGRKLNTPDYGDRQDALARTDDGLPMDPKRARAVVDEFMGNVGGRGRKAPGVNSGVKMSAGALLSVDAPAARGLQPGRARAVAAEFLAGAGARLGIGLAQPHGPPAVGGRPPVRRPAPLAAPPPADDPVAAANYLTADRAADVADEFAESTGLPTSDEISLSGELAELVRRCLAAAKFLQDRGDTNPVLAKAIMAHRAGNVGHQLLFDVRKLAEEWEARAAGRRPRGAPDGAGDDGLREEGPNTWV